MTKEVVSDFLKTASYFYRRGIRDSAAQYGDLSIVDDYLKSNTLAEPRKFRFIHGEYMSLQPMGGPGFSRMFANIITSRLPNIEKRRELCKGHLFKYIFERGFYTNEIYQVCISEYHRGLECGKTIPADIGQTFLERFYDKFEYGDIDPVSFQIFSRTKLVYANFLMWEGAEKLHKKRRQALAEGIYCTSKLQGFAAKLQKYK